MNRIEHAAHEHLANSRAALAPLDEVTGITPILTAALIAACAAATFAAFAAGNMVTDFVGQESGVAGLDADPAQLTGMALLEARESALRA